MKRSAIILLLSFIGYNLLAQEPPCLVQPDSLKGSYEGACSGGKANGFGKAAGTDRYEGDFKNGYPEGKGTYTWKNGNSFTGSWKKGLKEGKGEMHIKHSGKDSVLTGFWKKDSYKGLYESPYNIVDATTKIGRVQVTKLRGGRNNITIQVESLQTSGGWGATAAGVSTSVRMTSLTVITGSYQSKNSNPLTNKEITTLQSVVFPFRAVYFFGEHKVEIEIYEEGDWDISIPIGK